MTELKSKGADNAQNHVDPVAWRIFDGEGGFTFIPFEDNEDYLETFERRYPNHKGWVAPLYLEAELLSEEAVDAQRYRWLRANWTTMSSTVTTEKIEFQVGGPPWCNLGEDCVDSAIDAYLDD